MNPNRTGTVGFGLCPEPAAVRPKNYCINVIHYNKIRTRAPYCTFGMRRLVIF